MISVHIIKKHYECVIAIKYIYTIEPVISCHRSTKKRRSLVRGRMLYLHEQEKRFTDDFLTEVVETRRQME